MMNDLFNNIYVFHKGKKVSIAQHYDCPSSRLNGEAAMQEVGVMPDDGDWGNMHIVKFDSRLNNLIKVLEGIRDEIDQEVHNESSGKSVA